jgi:hypothetical protein
MSLLRAGVQIAISIQPGIEDDHHPDPRPRDVLAAAQERLPEALYF